MKPRALAALLFASCWLGLAADADMDFANIVLWKAPTGAWTNVGEVAMDPQQGKSLVSKASGGLLINGTEGKTGNIHTKEEFQDVEAHIEFMVPKNSNSGVYFLSRYEVQVFDSWGVANPSSHDCGAIYERWNDKGGYEGHPPRINASKAPGEWQTFDVVFRAPRFDATGKKTANAKFIKVTHNGQVVQQNVEVTGPTRSASFEDEKSAGPLMLQGDHGPVVYRNIRIKSVKLP